MTRPAHAAAPSLPISEMPLDELASTVTQGRALVTSLAALLPGLVTLSVDERVHSGGKLHAGEVAALKKLLTAAGKHPELFVALADKDGGNDAAAFEPQPAIDDLDRLATLQPLAEDVASFAQSLADTLLSFGAAARAVGVPVHALINANKSVAPALASDAAEGLEFFAAHGRRAARSRQVNAAAKASDLSARAAKITA